MYQSTSSLPQLLQPQAYSSPQQHTIELRAMFQSSWHVVATWKQLSQPGDFVTTTLLGTPIQVRNFDGELRALSNICAHRHCLLTHASCGSSPTMRCQYHGWEYGVDGRTRRIPSPKDFMPFDRDVHRLTEYRVARCGQLVFVSLSEEGPTLCDQLGDFAELCRSRFAEDWCETLAWEPEYAVNWKIPIENSLEAYHVPCIHPQTFRQAPGSERSQHVLLPHRTAFGTSLPFSPHSRIDNWFQKGEGWLMRRLRVRPTGEYWQHHIFPNLLFSFTDAVSLCHCVIPTGPKSSRAVVRQFGRSSDVSFPLRGWLARSWGRISATITKQILLEDMELFGDVQRGLDASTQLGLLGACEERIHTFQKFVVSHCTTPSAAGATDHAFSMSESQLHNLETQS